jgi:hypothetical protein
MADRIVRAAHTISGVSTGFNPLPVVGGTFFAFGVKHAVFHFCGLQCEAGWGLPTRRRRLNFASAGFLNTLFPEVFGAGHLAQPAPSLALGGAQGNVTVGQAVRGQAGSDAVGGVVSGKQVEGQPSAF